MKMDKKKSILNLAIYLLLHKACIFYVLLKCPKSYMLDIRLIIDLVLHDLDKLVYFKKYKDGTYNHQNNNNHHIEWQSKYSHLVKRRHIRHSLIDWESCRYTKKHKPLTAYEFYKTDNIRNELKLVPSLQLNYQIEICKWLKCFDN